MSEIEAWKHATFIYACYLVVGFSVTALTVWIFRSERQQVRLLDELETQDDRS